MVCDVFSCGVSDAVVEWRVDAENSRLVRSGAYAFLAAVTSLASMGVFVLLQPLLTAPAVTELSTPTLVVTVLLLVPVVALVAVLVPESDGAGGDLLFPIDDPKTERRLATVLTRRRAVAVAGPSFLVSLLLLSIDIGLVFAVSVPLFAWTAFVAVFNTVGRLDPGTAVIETNSGTIPVAEIDGYRSLRVGGLVICWLTYASASLNLSRRSLLTFSSESFEAFERVYDGTDRSADRSGSGELIVAGVLLLFAGLFAIAAVAIVRFDDAPLWIRGVLVVMIGQFAVGFLVGGLIYLRRLTEP